MYYFMLKKIITSREKLDSFKPFIFYIILITLCSCSMFNNNVKNSKGNNETQLDIDALISNNNSAKTNSTVPTQSITFQEAANYSHLKWESNLHKKIRVKLHPLINFSGIPLEDREEKASYYNHGKLPASVNLLSADLFKSSRRFLIVDTFPDYHFYLVLERYQLPFKYAPDDIWWQDLHDQTDRWLQPEKDSIVKLTLKINSAGKKIQAWSNNVEMTLSKCYLNQHPQPSSASLNENTLIRRYLSTAPGQTYTAATNYLVLSAINLLKNRQHSAIVTKKLGQEIYLQKSKGNFNQGDIFDVYYYAKEHGTRQRSAGQIKVIHPMGNQAVAYPISLRADHLRVGDKIGIGTIRKNKPEPYFIAANQCNNS